MSDIIRHFWASRIWAWSALDFEDLVLENAGLRGVRPGACLASKTLLSRVLRQRPAFQANLAVFQCVPSDFSRVLRCFSRVPLCSDLFQLRSIVSQSVPGAFHGSLAWMTDRRPAACHTLRHSELGTACILIYEATGAKRLTYHKYRG